MGFFSDLTDSVASVFSADPPASKPAQASEPAPAPAPTYAGTGGGTAASATAAFPHLADDAKGDVDFTELQKINDSITMAAQMNASLNLVNDAMATSMAASLMEIDSGSGFSAFGLVDTKRDAMKEQLSALTPELREKVLAQLAEQGADAETIAKAQDAADRVTHTEKRAAEEAKQVDASIAAAEDAAKGGGGDQLAQSLDALEPDQREAALAKMSPEAREAADAELARRRARLELIAERLEGAQDGVGVSEISVVANLSGLSATEAAELQAIYGEKYTDDDGNPRSLRDELADELGDSEDATFAYYVMSGMTEEADAMSVERTVAYIEDEADAWINADETAINELLRAHNDNPAAAKRIADAYEKATGKVLSDACAEVMDDAEYKEAHANIEGDPRTANVAILEQGDSERTAQVIEEVEIEEDGLQTLAKDAQDQTGEKLGELVAEQLPEDHLIKVDIGVAVAEAEVEAERDAALDAAVAKLAEDPDAYAEAKHKAEDLAAKLENELGKPHVFGNNTEVTDLLRGLGPTDVRLVMDAYAARGGSRDNPQDLEDDLRAKLEGADLKVANAALTGDSVLAAVALVQQSSDSLGTNVEGWKAAMETLKTPEERERFHAMMDQHVGRDAAYTEMVRSETTSFDRDALNATGIVDHDERVASMVAVDMDQSAHGGAIFGAEDRWHDAIGDLIGEGDEARDSRRLALRQANFWSNLDFNDTSMVEHLGRIENEDQLAALDRVMQDRLGQSTVDFVEDNTTGSDEDAALATASGDLSHGQAMRMVGELDNFINDRENEASLPFENPFIDKETKLRIAELPEDQREAALHQEQETARAALLENADALAQKDGYADYKDMLRDKLSPAEYAVAMDRIDAGRVSDHNALFAAGDTTIGNLGKDGGKFYEAMQDKTPEQIATLEADFEAAHPDIDFHEWVMSKAGSAGERRDFAIMLEGNYARMSDEKLAAKAAEDPQALIQRVKDLEAAARGGADDIAGDAIGNTIRAGGNAMGNLIGDTYGTAGDRLDARLEAVQALEDKLANGGTLSADEQQSLIDHMRYMSGDQKGFTDTKSSATKAVGEVGGTIVEAGTVAVTGNEALATAAGGLTEMSVTATLDPGRFSADQAVGGLIKTGAKTLGTYAGGKSNPLLGAYTGGAMGGLGESLGNTRNWNDADTLVTDATTNMVKQGTGGVAGKIAGLPGGAVGSAVAEHVATGDHSQTAWDQLTSVAKSAAKGTLAEKAGDYYADSQRTVLPHGNDDQIATGAPANPAGIAALEPHGDGASIEPGEATDASTTIAPAPVTGSTDAHGAGESTTGPTVAAASAATASTSADGGASVTDGDTATSALAPILDAILGTDTSSVDDANAAGREGGTDVRDLLAAQAAHGREIGLDAPVAGDAVGPGQVVHVGSSDASVGALAHHVMLAHTHPNAAIDPRMELPSGGGLGGDVENARAQGTTQAVVHDGGVSMFGGHSSSSDVPGLVGDMIMDVARMVQNVVTVPSTQLVLNHDESGNVVVWPSADNPEQSFLPIEFPSIAFAPGTDESNIDALRAKNDAALADSEASAAASDAAEAADTRAIVGYDKRTGQPLREGDTPGGVWVDLGGTTHFTDDESGSA